MASDGPASFAERRAIYEQIVALPGATIAELVERSKLLAPTVVARIASLAEVGHVRAEPGADATHYFATAVLARDAPARRVGGSPGVRDLLLLLLERPDRTVPELARALGWAEGGLCLLLRTCVDAGVVAVGARGPERTFRILERKRLGQVLAVPRGPLGWMADRQCEAWGELFPPG